MERLKQKLGLVDEQKRKTRMIEGNEESEGQEVIAWRMGLIAPNGPRKGKWDWFVLALCLYTSLSVPMGLGFYAFTDWGVSPAGFCFDIFVDVCFIVDLAVAFRTTYYNREGLLVVDKKLVARQYLKRWFWPDLLASFPFEHVATLITVGRDVTVPPSLRLPSMLKTLRVLRLGRKIDRLSSSKMFRIFQFTCMLLMAAHWYACLWFYMGGESRPVNNTINFSPGVDGTSWVYSQQIDDESRPFQYMMSFYWAITVLMKAPSFHPASPGEFAVAIIMIIIGCVLYAYFLGNGARARPRPVGVGG